METPSSPPSLPFWSIKVSSNGEMVLVSIKKASHREALNKKHPGNNECIWLKSVSLQAKFTRQGLGCQKLQNKNPQNKGQMFRYYFQVYKPWEFPPQSPRQSFQPLCKSFLFVSSCNASISMTCSSDTRYCWCFYKRKFLRSIFRVFYLVSRWCSATPTLMQESAWMLKSPEPRMSPCLFK